MNLNFDNPEIYEALLDVSSHYQVDPSTSLGSEKYFRSLLAQYQGSPDLESLTTWLTEEISQRFMALNERPKWVQGSAWPFVDGEPAIFVGQIDVSLQNSDTASQVFHDDTSFYVFIGKKKPPIVVMQQF